ncbi:hypothetical protein [Actinoallomurus sp. CA-142502]|uniref:hypothetical protein n=1 Tax=Actinoallomurus sp. CA-142502 TaxID=3239885 RepID=UPI003D920B4F
MRLSSGLGGCLVAAGLAAGVMATPASAATWTRTAQYYRWTGTNALERGQGVATDGTYFYYAGPGGMVKATISNDSEVASKPFPIPSSLSGTYHSDHIGDLEYYAGYVIAPIEDGDDGYQHPLLALYNASDLSYTGRYVQLPLDQMPGGVPWVAVDANAGLVYTAPWTQEAAEGTNELVVYHLSDLLGLPAGATLPVASTVTLSQPLSSIQGAASWEGRLYASVDTDNSVYSIDPTSGQVAYEFHQDTETDDEVEGIAAWDLGPTGGQLHIVNVGSGLKRIFLYLQHYTKTG